MWLAPAVASLLGSDSNLTKLSARPQRPQLFHIHYLSDTRPQSPDWEPSRGGLDQWQDLEVIEAARAEAAAEEAADEDDGV
eukprot:2561993-Pyramimonas_sp.AAC.1